MEPSPLAFALADHVVILHSSDLISQKTRAMEFTEFQEWLAGEIDQILETYGAHARIEPPPRMREPTSPVQDGQVIQPSRITDGIARKMLEAAPVAVQQVYGKARRNSETPAAALEMAMDYYARWQEAQRECQVNEYVRLEA